LGGTTLDVANLIGQPEILSLHLSFSGAPLDFQSPHFPALLKALE
jgi:hypothetical protein